MATGTLVDVVMPQMGVSVSEGTITRWAKNAGETVEADETIVEISTDKVDTEVPAPATGVVRELLAAEGETVPVNTRIAIIDTGGGTGETEPAGTGSDPDRCRRGAAGSRAGGGRGGGTPGAACAGERERAWRRGPHLRLPVVARMVAEHNLDINAISGTGAGGRVTKKDVQAFIDSGGPAAAPAAPAPEPEVHDVPHFAPPAEPETPPPPAAPPAAAPAPPPQAAPAVVEGEPGPGEELYRFNTVRKVIARHMRHSLETAAQVTTVIEVDMTGVVNLRKKWKPVYAERHGVNLTYVPFVARATMDAIGRWPWVNSEVRGETALIKRYVNLGMAVAIDDSKGLMVPVIRHAEELNLVGLSRAVIDLAEKARTKTLTPDEMSGGTFTITNPGVFGALIGTPIIPEGQVAILDVEAIVKRPVVVTDRHGNDAIAIRHMMFLCLSYDHRLVDGAYAAQFMAQVKQNLEGWDEDAYGL